MALVTVTATTPSVELLARPQIVSRFLRESHFGQTGTATATGSTNAEIVDTTRLMSFMFRPESQRGVVRVATTTDGAAPQGEIRALRTFNPEEGKLDVAPSFSAAVDSGDTYEIHYIRHPQDLLDDIDAIIKHEFYLPEWSILSEVDDFDMEQSATSAWTGTNASIAKRTAEPALNGRRWLRVTLTSDGGYAKPATTIKVDGGSSVAVGATARPAGSSYDAVLTLYDETNSATIREWSYSGETAVRFQENILIPSTCSAITLRLGGTTSGNICDWDDVGLLSIGSADVPLPWWVRDYSQVKGVFNWSPSPISATGSSQNTYAPDFTGRPTRLWEGQDSAFGRGQLKLRSSQSRVSGPMFIYGKRNEEAFTSDTENKHLDANLMNAALMAKVYAGLNAMPSGGAFNVKWIEKQREFWAKELRIEQYRQAQRVEHVFTAPVPRVLYRREG